MKIAATAPTNGIIPMEKISSSWMSNWMAIMMIGIILAGIAINRQFINGIFMDSNISE